MQERFYELVDYVSGMLAGEEVLLADFSGERSKSDIIAGETGASESDTRFQIFASNAAIDTDSSCHHIDISAFKVLADIG